MSEVQSTPETKVSCSGCRAVKCRCIPSDGERCQRCVRLDIPCVFQAHRRGRRRKDGSSPRQRQRPVGPSAGPSSPRRSISTIEADADQQPQDLPPASSVYHDVAKRGVFSIAGVMDEQGEVKTSPLWDTSAHDDPVGQRVVSMAECESLFAHYFDQLQTCVCLLDPAVHNPNYTRKASPQLFAAVLTVSSKFFRPELYESILLIADRLVNQAISDCVSSIEIVQAICLLHYWKKPTDSRGWLRLGHAIRLGYQLDLHLPRKVPLPADEHEARLVIDRERTWISLFCFDSTATLLSDRPSMMLHTPDVTTWIQSIPYPLPSDGQLDFAVKTSMLSSEVRQMQNCKGSYEVLRSGLGRLEDELHRSHNALAAAGAKVRLTSTSNSINNFSALAIQLLIECTLLFFSPRKHRIGLMHACISTSLDLLDNVVEGFGKKGIMPMIEDAHSVAVASTAVRLLRFMPYLDGPARTSVTRKLTNVVIVCREAARGDLESHPSYLARFIHLLLEKLHQSRAPSRAGSPALPTKQATPKTTPDQWWEEIGQFAYPQPATDLTQIQTFWEGFPTLAGAMNTVQPFPDTGGIGTLNNDGMGGFNVPWDQQWDADWLGLPGAGL